MTRSKALPKRNVRCHHFRVITALDRGRLSSSYFQRAEAGFTINPEISCLSHEENIIWELRDCRIQMFKSSITSHQDLSTSLQNTSYATGSLKSLQLCSFSLRVSIFSINESVLIKCNCTFWERDGDRQGQSYSLVANVTDKIEKMIQGVGECVRTE